MFQNYYRNPENGRVQTPTETIDKDGKVHPIGWLGGNVPTRQTVEFLATVAASQAYPGLVARVIPVAKGTDQIDWRVELLDDGWNHKWTVNGIDLVNAWLAYPASPVPAIVAIVKNAMEGRA